MAHPAIIQQHSTRKGMLDLLFISVEKREEKPKFSPKENAKNETGFPPRVNARN